jgi:hypothetical protein
MESSSGLFKIRSQHLPEGMEEKINKTGKVYSVHIRGRFGRSNYKWHANNIHTRKITEESQNYILNE